MWRTFLILTVTALIILVALITTQPIGIDKIENPPLNALQNNVSTRLQIPEFKDVTLGLNVHASHQQTSKSITTLSEALGRVY